jgi:hypothetical protein
MSFPWYRPDVPDAYASAPEKASRMYEKELGERAALLLRLGYSREEICARLRAEVRWDFELHARPAHLEKVAAIVETIAVHRGLGQGGPPSLDG